MPNVTQMTKNTQTGCAGFVLYTAQRCAKPTSQHSEITVEQQTGFLISPSAQ